MDQAHPLLQRLRMRPTARPRIVGFRYRGWSDVEHQRFNSTLSIRAPFGPQGDLTIDPGQLCSNGDIVSLLKQTDADHQCPEWVVCHERAVCVQRCGTVREMKEGPSTPAVRCRSQATASCCRQERWWRALRKRRDLIPAGKVERGERKRTADEVSKAD